MSFTLFTTTLFSSSLLTTTLFTTTLFSSSLLTTAALIIGLAIGLPLAICILDNLCRMLFTNLQDSFPRELAVLTIIFVALMSHYALWAVVARHLGHGISGLLDQVLIVL